MTIVEAGVLDEFDLDIQIEKNAPPAHKRNPRTAIYSCTYCCRTLLYNCAVP